MTAGPWYARWFGETYLELYSHRDESEAECQVETVLARWGEIDGPLLDLACGSGRHARAFARRGVRTVGLDLSATLLAVARDETPASLPARYLRGDMSYLPCRSESFAAVVSLFTSFGYFEAEDDNLRVLEEMARVLRPGGHLAIDIFNPGPTVRALVESETRTMGGREVRIRRWYDAARRRIEKEIRFDQDGEERRFLESVRAYEAEELCGLLGQVGLVASACFEETDDGCLEPLRPDSPRILAFAEKP